MRSFRYLILAAAIAALLAAAGCKRDYKAPEPKTASAERTPDPVNA